MKGRKRLGELLMETQKITQDQLDQALAAQKRSGERLGRVLIKQGPSPSRCCWNPSR